MTDHATTTRRPRSAPGGRATEGGDGGGEPTARRLDTPDTPTSTTRAGGGPCDRSDYH